MRKPKPAQAAENAANPARRFARRENREGGTAAGGFYGHLFIPGIAVTEIARAYRHWFLGTGEFAALRQARLASGVPVTWDAEGFPLGDHPGEDGVRLRIRRSSGSCLFEFRAPEDGVPSEHLIRIRATGDGVRLEHAMRRVNGSMSELPAPISQAPSILRELICRRELTFFPAELVAATPHRVGVGDIQDFVQQTLLNPDRAAAVCVLCPRSGGEGFLIDPDELARRLRTVASVHVLLNPAAAFRLSAALQKEGLSRELGCFDGGLRVYLPALSAVDPRQHRLWGARRLLSIPDAERTAWAAAEAVSAIHRAQLPDGFWHAIAEADAKARPINAPTPGECDQLWILLRENEARLRESERRASRAEQELEERDSLLERTAAFAEESQRLLEESTAALIRTQQAARGHTLDPGLREALDAVIAGSASPAESLAVIAALFPERIEVRADAEFAARSAAGFEHEYRDALFGALWTLANDYWQMLTEGHSAEHATSQCFGLVPAPGHLGIGATPSDPRAIRVRFNWNATRGRIVIEHCGRQFNLLAAIGTAD